MGARQQRRAPGNKNEVRDVLREGFESSHIMAFSAMTTPLNSQPRNILTANQTTMLKRLDSIFSLKLINILVRCFLQKLWMTQANMFSTTYINGTLS